MIIIKVMQLFAFIHDFKSALGYCDLCCFIIVPFVMTGGLKFKEITHNAALCDVATTVLDVMGLSCPEEMGGQSLLAK